MFRELVPHIVHVIINVVGHWSNKISTIGVEGKTGESGISPNILDIGTYWVTNFMAFWTRIKIQYHTQMHNYCSSPFDRIKRLFFFHMLRDLLNFNSSIEALWFSHRTLNSIERNHALCKSTTSNYPIKLRQLINLNDHRLD